ncbi:MAG TPA: hypothetical protein VD790_10325 [Thermoleophilaceae bacterium]|nr:hypothetical protein [Thermoleophilaceae bacterium]
MRLAPSTLAVTAAFAAAAFPAAAIEPGNYGGKTKNGFEMSFKVKGKKFSKLNGMVPTSCISPTGGTRVGGEIFRPPGKFKIGKTRKVSVKQEPAMHYSEVTKNYKVTLTKVKKGGVKAKLHVNFAFATVDFGGYYGPTLKTWVCSGDDSFVARS